MKGETRVTGARDQEVKRFLRAQRVCWGRKEVRTTMREQEEPSASPLLGGGASGAGVKVAVTSPTSSSPTRLARLAIPRFQMAAGSPGSASPIALVGSMGREPEEMEMHRDSF
jgi:hypothetical protein